MKKLILIGLMVATQFLGKAQARNTSPDIELIKDNLTQDYIRFNNTEGIFVYHQVVELVESSGLELALGSHGCFEEEIEGRLGQTFFREYCAIEQGAARDLYFRKDRGGSFVIVTRNNRGFVRETSAIVDFLKTLPGTERKNLRANLGARRLVIASGGGQSGSDRLVNVRKSIPFILNSKYPNVFCTPVKRNLPDRPVSSAYGARREDIYNGCYLTTETDFVE